jgi:hypothetical protein
MNVALNPPPRISGWLEVLGGLELSRPRDLAAHPGEFARLFRATRPPMTCCLRSPTSRKPQSCDRRSRRSRGTKRIASKIVAAMRMTVSVPPSIADSNGEGLRESNKEHTRSRYATPLTWVALNPCDSISRFAAVGRLRAHRVDGFPQMRSRG